MGIRVYPGKAYYREILQGYLGTMRVLVACEYSGIVRDAFARLGHDAWSCDLLPSELPGQHVIGDVRDILGNGWDMMIAHPPCTHLSYAGMAHWNKPGRAEKRAESMAFFMQMINAPIPRICVENPRGLPYQAYRQPDQEIHPYYFGDPAMKRTALWLNNLPKLIWWEQDSLFGPRTMCDKPEPLYVHERKPSKNYRGGEIKKRYFVDHKGSKDGYERARTFPAIARAMAEQWGSLEPISQAIHLGA